MKFLTYILITFTFWGLHNSPTYAYVKDNPILLVGCTPGDDLIKTQLSIPKDKIVDFIKWDLTLFQNSFVLNIVYGESQPNTIGFKAGGQTNTYQGEFQISKREENIIYKLKSNGFQTEIVLIKLSANVFHLLTPQNQLMIGNGGWSYTLNNINTDKIKYPLPIFKNSASILKDTAVQIIYEGRTPCQDFAEENNLTVSQSCFKLKWKLILNKDPKSLEPTTYTLKRTNSRETDIAGKWKISKGTPTNPEAFILQLDPDQVNKSISLFVGDENVLFFLHKDQTLYIGNEIFSFTLNKRPKT